ncbi:MAG: HAD-IIB family hydrolase [Desulfarculaceae bacterium]|nr:HAD-IIB family hydrolase [Desulfarculaceae bacterium]MCF8047196.1 HAD-IIB family hydrolase [Desulfarculaceae bacterium]MCF8066741.1 HAD-IIB family hydrolase [Desulfarculaceae bacterium]MCF8096688.1 HAD-IIB family hydrolase [Desulfarculaceae bacterium]MCF8121309.1 HAD-IIB family hydrolase [Desulfarculaceae bacterium]
MGLVIFSDLDGTLLDHHTYSYQPALPALDQIKRRGIPLVLCSSKTRAEMLPLHAELGLDAPIITENGGGIFAPEGCPVAKGDTWRAAGDGWRVLEIGLPINELRQRMEGFKDELGLKGFGDLSNHEVAKLTGLSKDQAARAREREFNEPLLPPGDEAAGQALTDAAQEAGLQLTHGGRFWHLLGGGDKGKAVRLLSVLYAKRDPEMTAMALGDAPNDLSMLAAVDRAVLVARPGGGHAEVELEGLILEPLAGPAGFNHAVLAALDELR